MDPEVTLKKQPKDFNTRLAEYRTKIGQVQHYLETGKYPQGLTPNQQRLLRTQRDTHVLKGGKVFYIGGNNKPARQVVITEEEIQDILWAYHTNRTGGGHTGVNITREKIASKFYWHGMADDVREYVSRCPTCQSFEKANTQAPKLQHKKGTSCKGRWNNIRDNYRKSLIKNSRKSGRDGRKIKLYKFSEQLSFLEKYMYKKDTKGNIGSLQNEENNHDNVAQQREDGEDNIDDDAMGPILAEVVLHEDVQTQPLSSAKPTFDSPGNWTKKKVKPEETAPSNLMEQLISKQENLTASASPHPVDAFLAGIAPTLKTLPPYYLNVAKSEIFATVQKYELQMLMNKHSSEGRNELATSELSASTPISSSLEYSNIQKSASSD